MKRPAMVGAIALTAACWLQSAIRGDQPSVVMIGTWLLMGALVGMGVWKLAVRFKS